ncbi:hypothetical protein SAMN04487820_103111 [Actinopolyspora mzabensis]|uniref:Aminodeoxyfutalosine deaminase/Imidazolonepropionase-like composite domain-containing protein n=1 Tax=Actinopolyspora mzabensis TaxID=995066 RepID=A0A1G8XXQ9_ACTMZ|nr:hypothetical protein [Actinopolyspora mzabensis]SDJ94954.1 hypothetical protein SAMN04487820_103111 [Actinopolyspora mzabensis]
MRPLATAERTWTGDEGHITVAGSVLVADGTITAVGTRAELAESAI